MLRLTALAIALLAVGTGPTGRDMVASARKSKIHLGKPHPEAKPDRKHEHITFDPMVSEVERHRDDEAWEKAYEEKHHERHHLEVSLGGSSWKTTE